MRGGILLIIIAILIVILFIVISFSLGIVKLGSMNEIQEESEEELPPMPPTR